MKTTQTNKRKQDAQDQDRLFSLSSMTWADVGVVRTWAERWLIRGEQSLKLQAQYDMKDSQQKQQQ